jgi:phosphoserine aminotransferase
MKNQYDNHGCLESGDNAENVFKLTAQKNGYLAITSTKEENINSHIDIWLKKNNTTFGVDVKASKRISRNKNSPKQDNLLWIELHSVRPNNKGWLYDGHAKFIAFEQQDTFIIIKREKLIELIPLHTKKIFVSQAHQAQGKLYQRSNRCDILTLIDTNIIIPYSTIWTKPL